MALSTQMAHLKKGFCASQDKQIWVVAKMNDEPTHTLNKPSLQTACH